MPLKQLLHLFYPKNCIHCQSSIIATPLLLCLDCYLKLSYSNQQLAKSKSNLFLERIGYHPQIRSGAAMFLFSKHTPIQSIIHQLKYEGKQEIGRILGRQFGQIISTDNSWNEIEQIIPVPLDEEKLKKRGYNQSEVFAEGLSEQMNIPISRNILYRSKAKASQTQKSRLERFSNVEAVFKIKNADLATDKHLLLVDDVLTTGATMEACAQALLTIPGIKLSLITIAITTN